MQRMFKFLGMSHLSEAMRWKRLFFLHLLVSTIIIMCLLRSISSPYDCYDSNSNNGGRIMSSNSHSSTGSSELSPSSSGSSSSPSSHASKSCPPVPPPCESCKPCAKCQPCKSCPPLPAPCETCPAPVVCPTPAPCPALATTSTTGHFSRAAGEICGVYWDHSKHLDYGVAMPFPEETVLRIDTNFYGPSIGDYRYVWWADETEKHIWGNLDSVKQWNNLKEIKRLENVVTPGSIAIDIGCHVGDSTLPMALLAARAPGNRVIGWEPNPHTFEILQYHAKINPRLNIETHQFAAASERTKLVFNYGGSNRPSNGGQAETNHNAEMRVEVQAENLFDFLMKNMTSAERKQISFIKIDTEGMDAMVLNTLKPLLTREMRPVVQTEIFAHFPTQSQKYEVFNILHGLDYQCYDRWMERRSTPENIDALPTSDIVCFPKEKEEMFPKI